jgi:hypothetical protein
MAGAEIVKLIQNAALVAEENRVPADVLFGTVTATAPLKIKIDDKQELPEGFFTVPEHLTDHTVEMTVNHATEIIMHSHPGTTEAAGPGPHSHGFTTDEVPHDHPYTGTKSFLVHSGLKTGDRVAMARAAGGQKYLVVGRVKQ